MATSGCDPRRARRRRRRAGSGWRRGRAPGRAAPGAGRRRRSRRPRRGVSTATISAPMGPAPIDQHPAARARRRPGRRRARPRRPARRSRRCAATARRAAGAASRRAASGTGRSRRRCAAGGRRCRGRCPRGRGWAGPPGSAASVAGVGRAGWTATGVPAGGPVPSAAAASDRADHLVAEQHRLAQDRHARPRRAASSAGRSRRCRRTRSRPRPRRGPAARSGAVRPGRRRRRGRPARGRRRSCGQCGGRAHSDHRRHAAVDEDRLPVDVVGGAGGQPHRGPDQVLRCDPSGRPGCGPTTQALNAASSTRAWVISVWM